MVSMVIDHVGAVLVWPLLLQNAGGLIFRMDFSSEYIGEMLQSGFTGRIYVLYMLMRGVIGRFAFPIYCFLLVEGFERTHSRGRYAGRLFLFALISEIPFDLAFSGEMIDRLSQNVFFTLCLGFLMMWGMRKMEELAQNSLARWGGIGLCFLVAVSVAEIISCDYGARGITAIALLFLFRKNRAEQILAGCAAFLYEITAPIGFVFVAMYNGQKGMKLKYIFYLFYPLHLMVLYVLFRIFSR